MARSNNRGRKSKKPFRSKEDERIERQYDRKGREDARNDVSWYSKNPNLLVAAGSFPFPNRPGMSIPLSDVNVTVGSDVKPFPRTYNIPGVLALDWVPHIGKSQTATDPASILGKEMYAKVRKAYSGSLNADAPDFVMYVMALDSVFAYIAWLKRLYRTLTAWSPNNYALPDEVLKAMLVQPAAIQSLRTNRTRLWQIINELVLQSRKFTCPGDMDIFNRHYWMSDNVYTDDATINSQFYLFNLYGVYQFAMLNMPDGNPGPGLKIVQMPQTTKGANLTVDDLYSFGTGLIDALVAWDEAYEINGYLMRAYEGSKLFIVDELPANEVLTPMYEPEVLMQIENSRTVPALNSNASYILTGLNVTQDVATNAVICDPKITMAESADVAHEIEGEGYTLNPWLSIRSDNPTVADSVVASRLHALVQNPVTASALITYDVVAASEIPLRWRLHNGSAWRPIYATPVYTINQDGNTITNGNSVYTSIWAVLNCGEAEQFDWHPFSWVTFTRVPSNGLNVEVRTTTMGDTHNVTFIQPNDLTNLHKICLYSELNSFSL